MLRPARRGAPLLLLPRHGRVAPPRGRIRLRARPGAALGVVDLRGGLLPHRPAQRGALHGDVPSGQPCRGPFVVVVVELRLSEETLHALEGDEGGGDLRQELREKAQRKAQHGEQRDRLVDLCHGEGVPCPSVGGEGNDPHEDGTPEERDPEPREEDRLPPQHAALFLPPLPDALLEGPLPGVVLDDADPLDHLRDEAHALVHVGQQLLAQPCQLDREDAGQRAHHEHYEQADECGPLHDRVEVGDDPDDEQRARPEGVQHVRHVLHLLAVVAHQRHDLARGLPLRRGVVQLQALAVHPPHERVARLGPRLPHEVVVVGLADQGHGGSQEE